MTRIVLCLLRGPYIKVDSRIPWVAETKPEGANKIELDN